VWDFFVDLVPGDVEEQVQNVILRDYHGDQKGHSISNWNHAIRDQYSGLTFVAGTLDFEYSSPMFNTSYDPAAAVSRGKLTPFTYWSAEFPYLPSGKPLEPGQSLPAGPVFILPGTPDPFAGLETYAQAVKEHNAVRLWPERGPENRVPTGWNSWTGSGGSGGYGSNIDEQLMLDNLDAMATQFRDFGVEWFQIDDGYEYYYGDWDWRPDRFPNGSAWMAQQIAARGLMPGLWIAAFQVDEDSQTYQTHEADGWFPDQLSMVTGGMPVVDLSHPDVLAWITDRFRRIRADGYRWVKSDFGYYALGAQAYHDPTVTREEAFRRGLAAVRAGLDAGAREVGGQEGDTFWLSVAMMGPHIGFIDGMRANLDTMPAWDKESGGQTRMTAQGFKPTVRTIARRYYLQNRVWIFNHDMLFFRSHANPDVPRITVDESRCLLTAVGLSGSVAKLGEKIVEMRPGWINDYRRVVPVFGHGARPLDLFEREYPEIWHLHVVPAEGLNTHGDGPAYDVVAFYNWGTNENLSVNPYELMADEPRTLSVDLGAIGLDPEAEYVAREFWSGEVLYSVRGFLTRTVQPHTVELFALRPKADRPQYLGGNRHLLQGAVEVRSLHWLDGYQTLSMEYDAAPGTALAPFEHLLDFRVPPGFTLGSAEVQGALPATVQSSTLGEVLTLRFEVDMRKVVRIELVFAGP
jgi:alpha-galactosidase